MNSFLLTTLLTWLQQYGYPALWLCVCVASIGLPLPISLVLLAAGAFAALGDFNIVVLALIAISASTCGDSIGYLLGRRIASRILAWFEHQRRFRILSPPKITLAHDYFKRRGAWAIFLSRFLFSGFGGIINLLAGAELYPYRRFLLYDFLGEVLGALIPLVLGYIFGASWEAVGDILGAFSGFVLALLIVILLIVRLARLVRQARTVKSPTSMEKEYARPRRLFTLRSAISKEHVPTADISPQLGHPHSDTSTGTFPP